VPVDVRLAERECSLVDGLGEDEGMSIRFPAPLRPGDRIGVTSPSAGVTAELLPRFEFCLEWLRSAGYDVVVGDCMDGRGPVSAPAKERAVEMTSMLLDPTINAVVPPWGGELAVEILPYLDFAEIAGAAPTWLVGFSDLSTLLLPLTTLAGVATLYGQNLMDTPYRVPQPLRSWLNMAGAQPGTTIVQGPSTTHRTSGFDRWQDDPGIVEFTLNSPGTWSLLEPGSDGLDVSGRLIGGYIETVSTLAGTRYGDLPAFARDHAGDEGLILYLEAAEDAPFNIARNLWRMRLAGWFDSANAVLFARTGAPDPPAFGQLDAVRSALMGLDIPVVVDVDCGHLPPHLALINGALTHVVINRASKTITQQR